MGSFSVVGGGGENRTPVRKSFHTAFSGRSPAILFPGERFAGRRVPLGIPLVYDGCGEGSPFTFTAQSRPARTRGPVRRTAALRRQPLICCQRLI